MDKFLKDLENLSKELNQIKTPAAQILAAKTALDNNVTEIFLTAVKNSARPTTGTSDDDKIKELNRYFPTDIKSLYTSWQAYKENPNSETAGQVKTSLKKLTNSAPALDKGANAKYSEIVGDANEAFDTLKATQPFDKELIENLMNAVKSKNYAEAEKIFNKLPKDLSSIPQIVREDIEAIRSVMTSGSSLIEAINTLKKDPVIIVSAPAKTPEIVKAPEQPSKPTPQPVKIAEPKLSPKDELIKTLDNLIAASQVRIEAQKTANQDYSERLTNLFASDKSKELIAKDQNKVAQNYGNFYRADETDITTLQKIKDKLLPEFSTAVADGPTRELLDKYNQTLGLIDFKKLQEEIDKKQNLEGKNLPTQQYLERAAKLPKEELAKVEELKKIKQEISEQQYITDIVDGNNLKFAQTQPSQTVYYLGFVNNPKLKEEIKKLPKTPQNSTIENELEIVDKLKAFKDLISQNNFDEEKASVLYGEIKRYLPRDLVNKIDTLQTVLKNDLSVNETDPAKTNTFTEAIEALPKYNQLTSPDRIAGLPVYANRREVSENEKKFLEELAQSSPSLRTINKAIPTEKPEVDDLEKIINVLKGSRDFFSKDGISGIQHTDITNLEKETGLTSGNLYNKLETLAQSYGKPATTGKEK